MIWRCAIVYHPAPAPFHEFCSPHIEFSDRIQPLALHTKSFYTSSLSGESRRDGRERWPKETKAFCEKENQRELADKNEIGESLKFVDKENESRKAKQKEHSNSRKLNIKESKEGPCGEQSKINMQIIEQEERLERVDEDS